MLQDTSGSHTEHSFHLLLFDSHLHSQLIHSIASSAADAYVRGARPALSRDYDSHVGATLTMKPAGIAQMYPKNALGALEAISGGKGAGANVNKKRSLSFGTEEYLQPQSHRYMYLSNHNKLVVRG